MNRLIIISEHDLVKYPPMQSMMHVILEYARKICYIGNCSDRNTQLIFENKGAQFYNLPCPYCNNIFSRYVANWKYRNNLKTIFKSINIEKEDFIIYVHTDTAYYIHDLLERYRYVVLFYEFINPHRSWKYRLMYSSYSLNNLLHKSIGVIHCEYNRAQITKGLYNLDKLPYIIPNKPYLDEAITIQSASNEIIDLINNFKTKANDKDIILYQGIFNAKERRLEEFCQAIDLLPDNYILVAMGGGNEDYETVKSKYESSRIIFLPFIKPPFHLYITQMASIGVLSYFPTDNSVAGVINPIYCAPNKIFEYSKYSIPMISNDIPGIKNIFNEYKCGRVVSEKFTPQQIKDNILEISNNYQSYANGALNYYNSVDIKKIIMDMIEDIDNTR